MKINICGKNLPNKDWSAWFSTPNVSNILCWGLRFCWNRIMPCHAIMREFFNYSRASSVSWLQLSNRTAPRSAPKMLGVLLARAACASGANNTCCAVCRVIPQWSYFPDKVMPKSQAKYLTSRLSLLYIFLFDINYAWSMNQSRDTD